MPKHLFAVQTTPLLGQRTTHNACIPMKELFLVLVFLACLTVSAVAQQKTYCNPINVDYGFCPIPDFVQNGKHRATADPAIVTYKGDYYLFSTNQWGYWWSHD